MQVIIIELKNIIIKNSYNKSLVSKINDRLPVIKLRNMRIGAFSKHVQKIIVKRFICFAVTYYKIPIKLDDKGDIIAKRIFMTADLNVSVTNSCTIDIIMNKSFLYLMNT